MTREEAIKILRREIECLSHTRCEDCILEAGCNPIKTTPYDSEYIEAYEIAVKALEQEPCDDAISRQAVFDLMRSLTRWCVRSEDGKFNNVGLLYDDVMFGIYKLSSVNPQEPKTGRLYNDIYDHYLCGNCKTIVMDYDNYCPNCGCRMQESEDEE